MGETLVVRVLAIGPVDLLRSRQQVRGHLAHNIGGEFLDGLNGLGHEQGGAGHGRCSFLCSLGAVAPA